LLWFSWKLCLGRIKVHGEAYLGSSHEERT
jgi:hypothetical protein